MNEEERRAERAQEVLSNELVIEAFDKLETAVITQLRRSPIKGDQASLQQQQLIMLMQMQDLFKRHFETIIETGMLARDKNLGSR